MSLLGIDPRKPDEFKSFKETSMEAEGIIIDGVKVTQEDIKEFVVAKKQKISDKLAPKGQAHRLAQQETAEFTPAQRVMRSDMARDLHKDGSGRPAVSAGVAVHELTGAQGGWVTDMAVDVINQGPNLNLSFEQWAIVQGLIEQGIKQGFHFQGQE